MNAIPVPTKKVSKKKVVKKATVAKKPRAPKMTAEEKKVLKLEKAYEVKRAKVAAENKKRTDRHDILVANFEKFCTVNKIKAVAFFADDKNSIVGCLQSFKMPNYEVEGLLSVQGFTKK